MTSRAASGDSADLPPTGCPAHPRALPVDGRPLSASPTLAAWRREAAASRLAFPDGHVGWIVTRHDLARQVLNDERFSQQPQRMPGPVEGSGPQVQGPLDDRAHESLRRADLLGIDEPQHSRLRRMITARFSVRAARGRSGAVAATVRDALARLELHGSPVDLTRHFSEPVSILTHCDVLGVPRELAGEFTVRFSESDAMQPRFDFLREILDLRRSDPGDDTLSDLLASDLDDVEVEGLAFVLMSSGHDSVAYMISTAVVALLTHPDQMQLLRQDPALMPGAIEEFMRFGAMFVTLFPRTATTAIEMSGVSFAAGETVSVSPVAANRDERVFARPDDFDITRDAFGHLGFGHGLHGCAGQQLARVEIGTAVSHLITAFPSLRLEHADQLQPQPFAHPVATYRAGAVVVGWD